MGFFWSVYTYVLEDVRAWETGIFPWNLFHRKFQKNVRLNEIVLFVCDVFRQYEKLDVE